MRRTAGLLVAFLTGVVGLVATAPAASAHPSDELLQQVYLTPRAGGLVLDLELTPGVLVGPSFLLLLDRDGDGTVSPAEQADHVGDVRDALTVAVDGQHVPIRVVRATYPDAALLGAGGGTIVLRLAADTPTSAGSRTVSVTDAYGPTRTLVQTSVTSDADRPVIVHDILRDGSGQTMTVRYSASDSSSPRPTGPATIGGGDAESASRANGSGGTYLFAALARPLTSPWALAALLLASAALGALHALTPGHGKALLAGYLVGARSTPRQAVALGLVVTATHTASVIGIGVLALVAARYVVPGVIVPALELGVGVVVAVLGVRLLRRRWSERPSGTTGHADAGQQHGGHSDARDRAHARDHTHHHSPTGPGRGVGSVLTMGISGGIVPCPEALAVLLLAVAVHRTALGLGMIVAFSAGLAAVLVGLGLLLVTPRLRRWLHRRGPAGSPAGWLIPLGSAAVVAVLGLAMTAKGAGALG